MPPLNKDIDRLESVEGFFASTRASIQHGGSSGFYSPGRDIVQMPELPTFRDRESYYATLAHEMTHWTRHASRLDRDLGRKRFADAGYAMEELVAEIGAAFLCAATSRRQSASRNRQAQMIFAKAAAPALPSSFGHRLGFSATTADTAAKASRPLPKIASILLTQTETSSLARR